MDDKDFWMLFAKASKAQRERAKNEAMFYKWGSNILNEPKDYYVYPNSYTVK